MPTWLRRCVIGLALFVAVVVAAVLVFAATFDANRYKGVLIDWMRTHQQRTLAIDGPIALTVFPRLGVSLERVTLSEHQRPDTFVSLQQATLSVQVLPLLRKELAVDRVSARGVRVVYRRDAQGRSNIDDLLAAKTPPADAGAAGSAGQRVSFDVRGVALDDVQATVDDAKLGVQGRFTLQSLSTGRLADGAESPVSLRGQAALAKPAVNAEVSLDTDLRLALPGDAPPSIALRKLQLALRGDGFDVKALDARLTGSLSVDGATQAVQADDLRLTLSGSRLGLQLKESQLGLASLRFEPSKRALHLEALTLKLAGQQGPHAVSADLSWPKLDATGDSLQGSALQGQGTLQGEPALKLTFASQAPSGSFERIRLPGVTVQAEGSGGGRSARLALRSDLAIAPQPFALALDALQLTADLADPDLPPLQLAVKGQAQASAKAAGWQLAGTANGQALDVSGHADLSRPVPKVDAKAQFGTLDLSRFVAAKSKAQAADKPAAAAPDAPVDLGALKAVDGSFSVRAASLVYPPYKVADAAIDATLAEGRLRVSQLAGRAWGGRFNGSASAEAGNQRVGLQLDATDVDIRALLTDVAQMDKLEGRGRVRANVTTSGHTVMQFKQQLGGTAAIALRDGAVRGINLAKTLRQWKAAAAMNQDAVQSASNEEKTDFSEITASFDIAQGVARNSDLDAKSPFIRVGGNGQIDIGKGRIDYLVKATVANTATGQDGKDLAVLRGVTVPVQLSGPFDAVGYKIQWSAVSAELLKKKLGDALGGSLGGAAGDGSAKDILRGILAPGAAGASAPAGAASAPKDPLKEGLKKLFKH